MGLIWSAGTTASSITNERKRHFETIERSPNCLSNYSPGPQSYIYFLLTDGVEHSLVSSQIMMLLRQLKATKGLY